MSFFFLDADVLKNIGEKKKFDSLMQKNLRLSFRRMSIPTTYNKENYSATIRSASMMLPRGPYSHD